MVPQKAHPVRVGRGRTLPLFPSFSGRGAFRAVLQSDRIAFQGPGVLSSDRSREPSRVKKGEGPSIRARGGGLINKSTLMANAVMTPNDSASIPTASPCLSVKVLTRSHQASIGGSSVLVRAPNPWIWLMRRILRRLERTKCLVVFWNVPSDLHRFSTS